MPVHETLRRDNLVALHRRLSTELARWVPDAPGSFLPAWQMALDENFEATSTELMRVANARPRIEAHWQAFATELAYEVALFTETRDAETLNTTILAIVTDAFTRPAIAA